MQARSGVSGAGYGGGVCQLFDLPTCRFVGLSVCWEVGDLASWHYTAASAGVRQGEMASAAGVCRVQEECSRHGVVVVWVRVQRGGVNWNDKVGCAGGEFLVYRRGKRKGCGERGYRCRQRTQGEEEGAGGVCRLANFSTCRLADLLESWRVGGVRREGKGRAPGGVGRLSRVTGSGRVWVKTR